MRLILSVVKFTGSNQARLLRIEISYCANSMIHITSASTHIDHDSLR